MSAEEVFTMNTDTASVVNTKHADALSAELAAVTSIAQFCQDWTAKWRQIAVSAQSMLSFFFPPAASVIGFLISIADNFCGTMSKPSA